SLIALRFGAPLLLVFLLLGMLAGEGGPGGIKFDDVGTAYTVGSIALALILFDGGLRTRIASLRNVIGPAVTLATVGVLITALLTAPVAKFVLGVGWIPAFLIGAVVASTDAAAVFFLINARGRKRRPRALMRKKTAAASVDATTAPMRKAGIQPTPSTNFATGAVRSAVISTPTVASVTAGPMTLRRLAMRVRRPPSNRISASAIDPTV